MRTTHEFESTGEAYDACQTEEAIKTGDILLIPSERVVGIADTWPVAVTVEHGHLHFPVDGCKVADVFDGSQDPRTLAIEPAKAIAQRRDWPVRD